MMRLRALLFATVALAGTGFGAYRIGEATALRVERTAAAELRAGLDAAGEGWAQVTTDGLRVRLSGEAPDEARRLRAAEIARQTVAPRRVEDATVIAAADPLAPPPFAIEMLRSEDAVSLVGIAPDAAGRARIDAALAAAAIAAASANMLESVDYPPPPGWAPALDFAIDALTALPQARISVRPDRVSVAATVPDAEARAAVEARLRDAAPEGLVLELAITAPRPAIAPFRLAYERGRDGPRLSACAAETDEAAARIAAAAGRPASDCAVGPGAPSPDWEAAAVAGIAAVDRLGGGRLEIVDLDAILEPPAGADPAAAAEAAATLDAALPAAFALSFEAPPSAAPEAETEADGPRAPRFDAALGDDGLVRLEGAVQDEASREAIGSFAAALFGHDRVQNATVLDAALPEGWPSRVLAGVEALSLMKEGHVEVTAERVALAGWAAAADGAAKAAALFAGRDLGPADLSIRFDAAAAAAEAAARAAAEDPAGACAAAVTEAQARAPIAFEPGSADLDATAAPAIAALAEAFADCPPVDFEVAGHTDGQGDPGRNQALSEARAEAVKAALDAAGLRHLRFVARGYGPAHPIADNDTEEGRAQNRRIEFNLIVDGAPPPDAARVAENPEDGVGPQ